ncbi:hypothetical protein DFH28DRAFT_206828 [Melampsora americana]|nr:hypothetical protein DFH28DRAFT_206828 [Melampsora americana]
MSNEFEDKLKTRGLDWTLDFLGKCGEEGNQISHQISLLLKTKSLLSSTNPLLHQEGREEEEDLKPIELRDYLEDLILKLQESNQVSTSSHQTILNELKRSAVIFRDSLNYSPVELEKVFIQFDFLLWFTYLALQLLYKFEVQPLRITGLVEFLNQGPLPEVQTCLRFQLAHAHLLLDEIQWASHYIEELEAEVTFKDHLTLNTELEFLTIRRDFHLARFELTSDNLHKLLYKFNHQTDLDIYLDLYLISLILSSPSKRRYQRLIQCLQIITLSSSLPFYEILESISKEEMISDLPIIPTCLTRRLIEKGVLIKSLRLHNLWVRSKAIGSPLSLIDLPITLGFKTLPSVAQALLQELIDNETLRVRFDNNMITFLDEKVERSEANLVSSHSKAPDSHLVLSNQLDQDLSNQITSLIPKTFHTLKETVPLKLIQCKPQESNSLISLKINPIEIFPDHHEHLDTSISHMPNSPNQITSLDDHPTHHDQIDQSERKETINLVSESDNGSGPGLSNSRTKRRKRPKSNPEGSSYNPYTRPNQAHLSDSLSSNQSSSDLDYSPRSRTTLPDFMSFKTRKKRISQKSCSNRISMPQEVQSSSGGEVNYLIRIETDLDRCENVRVLNQVELDKIDSIDYLTKNLELIQASLRYNSQGRTISPAHFVARLKHDPEYSSLTGYAKDLIESTFQRYLEYYCLRSTMSLRMDALKIILWFLQEKGSLCLKSLRNYVHVFQRLIPLIDKVLRIDGTVEVNEPKEGGLGIGNVKDHPLWLDLTRIKKDHEDEIERKKT